MRLLNLFGISLRPAHHRTIPLPTHRAHFIGYGSAKKDGSHDHRSNRGADRTPAQKSGDRLRSRRN